MIQEAAGHLNSGGWLIFEVGIRQASQILQMFEKAGLYENLFTARDAGGIERVVGGMKIR